MQKLQLGFAPKTLFGQGVGLHLAVEHFERHQSAAAIITRLVNGANPALSQLVEQGVVAEDLMNHGCVLAKKFCTDDCSLTVDCQRVRHGVVRYRARKSILHHQCIRAGQNSGLGKGAAAAARFLVNGDAFVAFADKTGATHRFLRSVVQIKIKIAIGWRSCKRVDGNGVRTGIGKGHAIVIALIVGQAQRPIESLIDE